MIFHLNSIHEKPEIFPIQKKKKNRCIQYDLLFK